MCTSQRALLSHHWVHSGRTHSLSRPGGLPTRARPEATNGHSTDLYTPRQPTPTSIRCRPDRPAAPATSWRRSARLEAPGAPKIAEPATSSSQQPDWASDPPPRRPEMVSPTPEGWRTAGGGQLNTRSSSRKTATPAGECSPAAPWVIPSDLAAHAVRRCCQGERRGVCEAAGKRRPGAQERPESAGAAAVAQLARSVRHAHV